MNPSDIIVALCDGHGQETAGKRTPIISSIGRFIRENEFNREVIKFLNIELLRCGFKTLLVAPTDKDTSLSDRVKLANNQIPNGFGRKADLYISVHYNAFDGKFDSYDPEGFSVHVHPNSKNSHILAKILIEELAAGTIQKNRGVKENDFYVLRETHMTAILSENGFMDNQREALLMLVPEFQKEVAIEHARAICKFNGVEYMAENIKIENKTPILGESIATVYQMITFAKKSNPNFNEEIAKQFYSVGKVYGIRGDIAFCQSIHETGWFKFGGDVKAEQNNFCGLGATGGVAGNKFATVRDGVIAQIQHLLAYGSKNPVIPSGHAKLDPRYDLVSPKGKAPYWEDLGGKWAVPGYSRTKYSNFDEAYKAGATYGQSILKIYDELIKVVPSQTQPEPIVEPIIVKPIPVPIPTQEPVEWKQDGLNYLIQAYGIDPKVWNATDIVDIGTLGIIIKRRDDKIVEFFNRKL